MFSETVTNTGLLTVQCRCDGHPNENTYRKGGMTTGGQQRNARLRPFFY